MKIDIRHIGDVDLVDVSGRITVSDGASSLEEALRLMATKGRERILLNVKDVYYIDSSGLESLVSIYATLSRQGVTIKLLNLTNRVKEITNDHKSVNGV